MKINNLVLDFIGHANVNPRLLTLDTQDDFSTVLTNNYLLPLKKQGYAFLNTDFILIACAGGIRALGYLTVDADNVNINSLSSND